MLRYGVQLPEGGHPTDALKQLAQLEEEDPALHVVWNDHAGQIQMQLMGEVQLEVLQRLVDAGNTVVVIEHNLDVIKCADHLLALGPEGGDGGGTIVCTGTPEEVAACPASFTGQYLKRMLK